MNTRAWRWAPLLVVAVGALSSGCIELPDKAFSCARDGDCEQLGSEGEVYVCREKVCVQPGPGGDPDGGLDGGTDGGTDGGSDGGTDGGTDAGTLACPHKPELMPCHTPSGWCWDNPLAATSSLLAIRGRSENDILAVGENGVALSWNGGCWSLGRTGTASEVLRGIWPAPGKAWQVVGSRGLVLTYDGDASTPMTHGAELLRDISGGPDGSAFAVGNTGTLFQVLDGGWNPQDAGTTSHLAAVWTVSRNEAWAFAEDGGIFHGVGGVWQPEPSPPAKSVAYTGAVGLSDGGLLAVGMGSLVRREATGWKQFDFATPTTPLNGVWHDSGLTWIVGGKGSIYREDGSSEPSGTSQTLNSVWSLGQKAWAVGEGGVIVQRTGSTWDEAPGGVTRTVRGLWSMPDGLWAVGENRLIMRRVQNVWRPVPPPEQSGANARFTASWGSGDVLLVVEDLPDNPPDVIDDKVHVYQGGRWTVEIPGGNLSALWGTGAGQVWAVGGGGTIQRRDSNGSWTEESYLGDLALNAIWGSSATNVWAVGNLGRIYLRDPSCTATAPTCKWNPQTSGAPDSIKFTGVWGTAPGTSPGKLWAVAATGPIYHFDGTTWTTQSIDLGNPGLAAITGRDEKQLWAVGGNGAIAVLNASTGNTWNLHIVATGRGLMTVHVAEGSVWAGGRDGTIFRHP